MLDWIREKNQEKELISESVTTLHKQGFLKFMNPTNGPISGTLN